MHSPIQVEYMEEHIATTVSVAHAKMVPPRKVVISNLWPVEMEQLPIYCYGAYEFELPVHQG